MVKTLKLEEKIKESGLKKAYIAKQLGMSPFTLTRKINNRAKFDIEEASLIAKLLNLTANEVQQIFLS